MPNLNKIVDELLQTIGDATSGFNNSIDPIQRDIYNDVELLVKDLDLNGDKLANTVKNVKAIGALKNKIEKIILNKDYIGNVKDYVAAFDSVSKLQNNYFSELSNQTGPTKLLDVVKQQSIEQAVNSLTESGISANVTQGIQDILKRNITGGSSYTDLLKQMRNFILTNETGTGALERYTKQITTDSLNQFSAQYSQVLTNDLGLDEWYMYVGSNKDTTREFCERLTKKKYIHRSELADIVNGIIDGVQVPINPKTKTWYGGVPGTNVNNIQVVRGGYGCDHQLLPVNAAVVPQYLRAKFGENEFANKMVSKTPETALSNQKEWIDTLSKKQKDSFTDYTETAYKDVNLFLRKNDTKAISLSKPEIDNYVKQMTAAMKNAPVFQGDVHRGIEFMDESEFNAFYESLGIGNIFVDKGFMSTDINSKIAKVFSNSNFTANIKVESKSGVPISELSKYNKNETEVLFKPNSKFEIVDVKKVGNELFLSLKEL